MAEPLYRHPREHGRHDSLTGVRERASYTRAEQLFSETLKRRLGEVLEGKRDHLPLIRRYPNEANRVGVIRAPLPPDGERPRPHVAEGLSWDAIHFVRSRAVGGPVSQSPGADGTLYEVQDFPTKYPHIVVERVDRFEAGAKSPSEITWSLRRVQNQRTQTYINRLLDVASLLFDLFGAVK